MWNKGWDKIFEQNRWGQYPTEDLVRFIARRFGSAANRKNISILEIGCGPGANIWYLSREGYSVFGIDGSRVAIRNALARLKRENLRASLFIGDILGLPFADCQFDCVVDIECIYANSLKDSRLILREVDRVLKPGGVFFSKTFMAGTHKGSLHKGYGIIRFIQRKDIPKLYGCFRILNIDYAIRSQMNGRHTIKEWLITCQKKDRVNV